MADGLNKVLLLGNLGADPELRVTQGGSAVLKIRLATTETYLDKNNTRQEKTEWHQVTLWGKRGEALSKFLKKGDRIFVEGGIRTTSYEKNGEKRYSTEVNATNVILAGGGKSRSDDQEGGWQGGGGSASRFGGGASAGTAARAPSGPPRDAPAREAPQDTFDEYGAGTDDEIPF